MNTIKIIALPIILLIVSYIQGCSTASPIIETSKSQSGFSDAVYKGEIIEVSKNTQNLTEYRVFQHGDSGFVALNTVRARAESRANRFCEQRGLAARSIREQSSVPPHILGNFPRVELTFVCEEATKSQSKNYGEAYQQLETLGNLLEKGLITQDEFNQEKAKLFKSTGK
jgi:hypothetical protein